MKLARLIVFLLAGVLVMWTVSCSPKKATPTGVVETYLKCLKVEKFDDAVKCFQTDSTATAEDLKALSAKMEASIEKQGGLKSYELIKDGETIAEDGLTAEVKAKMVMGNGEEQEADFKLNKENDEWKIDLKSK
ncbi:MAG: DUF4878 domain-containing protein [Bacteroidales bacterium]|jgi:hypothetical protein|nr:DUF4878 domain-containing protein [Bacteroidales bacterium]